MFHGTMDNNSLAPISLTLFCIVEGESVSHAFHIKNIASSDDVADLKKLIKEEKSPEFNDIAVNRLTLWRISIPESEKSSAITSDALDDKTEWTNQGPHSLNCFAKIPTTTLTSLSGDPFQSMRPSLPVSPLLSHMNLVLAHRCWLIERCSSSGYTVPIFGVSGCGKTRGMAELLSRRWRFYFNAVGDYLGSGDIIMLISDTGTRLQSDREANNRQTRVITYLLLLSRLKIPQRCLAISGSYQTFTSARIVGPTVKQGPGARICMGAHDDSVLTEVFKTHALSDWPHEPLITSQCAELAGNAVIVGLNEQTLWRWISHEHISMENFMDAHVNTNSFRQGKPVPPFFFPKAKSSGLDIVFYIRVKGKLFPVFSQL
ncbi:MAG: hypothetical protein J3R72DRAFT_476167 [Linnemannia gamsii]|nr:MAG: hypothetical protein J3R72DRAFT_476167 [Linnemannia gamsii]